MRRAIRTSCFLGLAFAGLAPVAAEPPKNVPPATVQANYQQPRFPASGAGDPFEQQYQIQLDVPSMDRVLRVENDAALFERIRQEYRTRNDRAVFPQTVELDKEVKTTLQARQIPPQTAYVQPSFVVYNPLYFEDLNTERYGWEMGALQPLISTCHFYKDLIMLPYNSAVLPPWCCDANSGYYNVGEPVPYICYTPPWSWKGAIAEAGTFVGGAAIFP